MNNQLESSDSEDDTFSAALEVPAQSSSEIANNVNKKRKHLDIESEWTVIENNISKEECDAHDLFYSHRFAYSLNNAGVGAGVYSCSVHQDCPHQLRVRKMKYNNEINKDQYQLCERGIHSGNGSTKKRCIGLQPGVLKFLDPMLHTSMKPTRAALQLKELLGASEEGKELLPTLPTELSELITKIANRKRTLKQNKTSKQTPYHLNRFLMAREINLTHSPAEVKNQLHELISKHGREGLLCCARLPLPPNSELLRSASGQHGSHAPPLNSASCVAATITAPVPHDGASVNTADGTHSSALEVADVQRAVLRDTVLTHTHNVHGYVFTCAKMMNNISITIRDTLPIGACLSLDGTYISNTMCPDQISRDVHHQQYDILTKQPLPQVVVQRALDLINTKHSVLRSIVPQKGMYVVNSSRYKDLPLTKERFNMRKLPVFDSDSFDDLATRLASYHRVRVREKAGARPFYVCDCKAFHFSGYLCSHVLVSYHYASLLDLSQCVVGFTGPRLPGRPTQRSTALNKDALPNAPSDSTSSSALRGVRLAGAHVRGVGTTADYKSGIVGPYNGLNKTFTVTFPDAPEGPKVVTMSEQEVITAFEAHLSFMRNVKESMRKNVIV